MTEALFTFGMLKLTSRMMNDESLREKRPKRTERNAMSNGMTSRIKMIKADGEDLVDA